MNSGLSPLTSKLCLLVTLSCSMSTYLSILDDSESTKRPPSDEYEGSVSSVALVDKVEKDPSPPSEKYVFPMTLVGRLGMAHYRIP